jgi:alpha-galactosidase
VFGDSKTGLEVSFEMIRYEDFPAVEWVLRFGNKGHREAPTLEDVRALDVRFRYDGRSIHLHRALGSSNKETDFSPVEHILKPGAQISLAPVGGLSSNSTSLPFFNVDAGPPPSATGYGLNERGGDNSLNGGGVMIGLGWSGEWSMTFTHEGEALHLQGGMERTRLKLLPGEVIRTPRVLLLFWQGPDRLRAHNLLRSFLLTHRTPRPLGQVPTLPIAAMPWFLFEDGNQANEANQLEFAALYFGKGIPIDTFWLDAGWFEGGWPNGVGNWSVRKDAFPKGLRPLADAVHRMGMRFLVWFEPETVAQGTWLDTHHPEWLLGAGKQKLLNLGNEEGRRWLVEHVSQLIGQEGIDIYRNDFSLDLSEYWRTADEPDREGVTQIRYIEGLYDYWDELLRRNPALLIDNAASGGRRIDLETISRSVPLWRSDYFGGRMAGFQAHGVGLGLYVPLSATGVPPTADNPQAAMPDVYTARSTMGAGTAFTWDVRLPGFNNFLAERIVKEQNRIRKFYYGDLYPLTAITTKEDAWLAYQCDRPDLGEGMVMAFRRSQSREQSLIVELRALKPDRLYEVENVDLSTRQVYRGAELAEAFPISITAAPGSVLVIYRLRK